MFRVLLKLCFEIQAATCYRRGSGDGENAWKAFKPITKSKKHQKITSNIVFFSNINVQNNLRFLPRTATYSVAPEYFSELRTAQKEAW